jgi:integrase
MRVTVAAPRGTFFELCTMFTERYAREPEYRDGRKIAGMRSWENARGHVELLKRTVGDIPIAALTFAILEDARDKLLSEVTHLGTLRSAARVNRIMSTCRLMLNKGRKRGMIDRNPFDDADSDSPLINKDLERKRTRIATREEEAALLEQCTDAKKRAHLRPIIIVAVETGMRLNEILQLQRRPGVRDEAGNEKPHVNWKRRTIEVTEFFSKAMKARSVPMTARLMKELKRWEAELSPADSAMFGNLATVDTAWRGAKKDAKVKDLRFHDQRHTATTRMIHAGVPGALVSQIVGHEAAEDVQPKTARQTRTYINLDEAGSKSVAATINRRRPRKISGEAVN